MKLTIHTRHGEILTATVFESMEGIVETIDHNGGWFLHMELAIHESMISHMILESQDVDDFLKQYQNIDYKPDKEDDE